MIYGPDSPTLCSVVSKMFPKAGFLLLAVAIFKVSAEFIEPEFIEDVRAREAENSAQRIVSGWAAVLGQHPHHASIRMVGPDGGVSVCGGSFVHRDWVITAAHCTAGRITIVVRGGMVSLTTPEYIFETTQWWNYPTYNDNFPQIVQPDDISIMKLQRPITITSNLKPIRIQPSADAFRDYEGEIVHASGNGHTWTSTATTEELRWVYLRAVSNPTCQTTFGTAIITNNTICARWFNVTSQSTCHGDSGGPLVHVDSDAVETLVGVTSFVAGGEWGCHSGLPAGFIRPGPFHSWFTEVTGLDFENLQEEDEDTTDPPAPEEEDESGEGSGEDDSSNEDSSESDEDSDEELSQIMKKLQVNVKVKIVLNKYNYKKEIKKEKEISKEKRH